MGPDTEINKFGVAVIESIPEGQCHTGEMLCRDVLSHKHIVNNTQFYRLYKVGTVKEFQEAVKSIISAHQDDEMLALHIEAHGNENGISLSSGEQLPWKQFLDMCRELNNELCGLLIVTTALCYSISLMAAIDPSKRAPFKAVVITRRDVTTDEVYRGYSEYYSVYNNIFDMLSAFDAMRTEVNAGTLDSSPFACFNAGWFFDQVTNPDRAPDAFRQIVNEHFCIKKSEDPSYTRERVEKEIRELFSDLSKNKRDYFLYKDIY